MRVWLIAALSVGWVPVALIACNNPDSVPPRNVVIIILDTVRADHLHLYGYDRETSPALDALAADARVFRSAYSTSTWTSPAHASLFTGLLPAAHGTTQQNWTLHLPLRTLAEILSEHEFETAAFVGNPMLSVERHFDQGFSTYVEAWKGNHRTGTQKRGDLDGLTVEAIERFLVARRNKAPLFLFVNLIGAHSPYDSCGRFCGHFLEGKTHGVVANEWWSHYLGRREFSREEIDELTSRYDGEILRVDYLLRRIVSTLEKAQIWKDALVFIASDHGENLGDHGQMDHVFSLYESTVRIPLVALPPRLFPREPKNPCRAQIQDVFRTIVETILPGEVPPGHGEDLRFCRKGPKRRILLQYARPVQALALLRMGMDGIDPRRVNRLDRSLWAIIDANWKWIEASDGGYELYKLDEDPREAVDLSKATGYADQVQRLSGELDAMRTEATRGDVLWLNQGDPPISEETLRALRSLGYAVESH